MNYFNFSFISLWTILFAFLIYEKCTMTEGKPHTPIILVPGDGGSQVYGLLSKEDCHCFAGKKWFQVWLKLSYFIFCRANCLYKYFRLIYDHETRTAKNVPGVITEIRYWGGTRVIEYLDFWGIAEYYHSIVKALVVSGYMRNVDVRGAPYDFRKAPNENKDFVPKMMALVEDTFWMNNGSRVMLAAHSLGNQYVIYFLRLMTPGWRKKFVRGFVAISPPLGGAVKAVQTVTSGDFFGIGKYLFCGKTALRDTQRTLPSISYLFPSSKLWKSNEVIGSRPGRNYTVANYHQLFTDIPFPDGWEMYKDSAPYADPSWIPDVDELYCGYGVDVPTSEVLIWKGDKKFPDDVPDVKYGDGDGTVNIRSLSVCHTWPLKALWTYSKASHVKVLSDQRLISDLRSVLFQPDTQGGK